MLVFARPRMGPIHIRLIYGGNVGECAPVFRAGVRTTTVSCSHRACVYVIIFLFGIDIPFLEIAFGICIRITYHLSYILSDIGEHTTSHITFSGRHALMHRKRTEKMFWIVCVVVYVYAEREAGVTAARILSEYIEFMQI